MTILLVVVLLILLVTTDHSNAAQILALAHYQGRSNFAPFEAVLRELSTKGHKVTLVSHFPPSHNVSSYISIAGSLPLLVDGADVNVFDYSRLQIIGSLMFFGPWSMEWCEKVLEHDSIQKLIHSEDLKFDLIMTHLLGPDCLLGFAHKFSTPVVSVIANAAFPWAGARIGNPEYPSYVPTTYFPSLNPMSLLDRTFNVGITILLQTWHNLVTYYRMDPLAKKYFGDSLPPLRQLARDKTALLLVNSHCSMNQLRPSVPAFIEIGGIHIKEPKPLPKELEDFFKSSQHGIIYFSLGSMVRLDTFPREKLEALLEAFSELPQKVLIKGKVQSLPVPNNVLVRPWLPQQDILAHPAVRVFVAHAGLLGMQEAVHFGVPVVVMPFYGDQIPMAATAVQKGYGVRLDYHTLTKKSVLEAINTVLDSPSYKEKALWASMKFKDRIHTPSETATYWVEYVLRNGKVLSSNVIADLPWYSDLLLDVLATLLLGITVILFVMCVTIRFLKKTLKYMYCCVNNS